MDSVQCPLIICLFQLGSVQEIVYGSGLNEYNLYGTCEGGIGVWFDRDTNKVAFSHQIWQQKNNHYISQKMKVIDFILFLCFDALQLRRQASMALSLIVVPQFFVGYNSATAYGNNLKFGKLLYHHELYHTCKFH